MKHIKLVLLLGIILPSSYSFAQKDTIYIHGMLNLQGMYQRGNLNQISGNSILNLGVKNTKWYLGTAFSYGYVKVGDFNVINDLWVNEIVKYNYQKRVYPVGILYYGFAKSFGIQNSIASGVGGGMNIAKKSPLQFLEVNLLGGYIQTSFMNVQQVSSTIVMSVLKANLPLIKGKLNGYWEFHSYNSFSDDENYGFQNTARLSFSILKRLDFTWSNVSIYSNIIDAGKKRMNTTSLVGIAGKF